MPSLLVFLFQRLAGNGRLHPYRSRYFPSPRPGLVGTHQRVARVVSAIPSNTILAATALLADSASSRISKPSTALNTGTESCTVPAEIVAMRTRTQYHTT